eukprot:m.273422 g.273422  ORF g.273422 m.273422 type:complete len:104 (+) comp54818_c0_seq4:437-748(+)
MEPQAVEDVKGAQPRKSLPVMLGSKQSSSASLNSQGGKPGLVRRSASLNLLANLTLQAPEPEPEPEPDVEADLPPSTLLSFRGARSRRTTLAIIFETPPECSG